jgi:hypothetical protein
VAAPFVIRISDLIRHSGFGFRIFKPMSLYSAILAGFGSQLPDKRLTNDDLS